MRRPLTRPHLTATLGAAVPCALPWMPLPWMRRPLTRPHLIATLAAVLPSTPAADAAALESDAGGGAARGCRSWGARGAAFDVDATPHR